MSKINPKRAYAKEILENFSDIGSHGVPLADDDPALVNFRIREDGSLEKRCGWRVYENYTEGDVRGAWQGVLNGVSLHFVVCASSVLLLRGNQRSLVSLLSTNTGEVSFFVYCNALYLMDGRCLRIWDASGMTFRAAEGYVPLYGKGWDPVNFGEVYEDLNLFTNRLRVQYRSQESATKFMLPYYAESIDFVKVNGIKTTAYSFSATLDSVTLAEPASFVEIGFTIYLDSETTQNLLAATRALPVFLGAGEQLLLYGAPRGHYLYLARAVSDSMLATARSGYPTCDRLYFRESDVMIIGDADNPITTVCRDGQRLLAFHPTGAAAVVFPEEEEPTYYAMSEIPGCSVRGMDISVGGDRYILNATGLFRLVHDSGSPDDLRAIALNVSLPLDDPDLHANLLTAYLSTHDEIWLRDARDTKGGVYVYQPLRQYFYRFDHIPAQRLLTVNGLFGFFCGNNVCVFEEHLTTDANVAFEAVATTGWLHFGCPETKKRSLRLSLLAHNTRELKITLESEHRQCKISRTGAPLSSCVWDTRVPIGRFRTLRTVIRDRGVQRPRITRLALYANL